MVIGVDAGALAVRDERLKVGVFRVTLNLLKGLDSIDRKNTYRLYTFAPLEKGITSELGKRFEQVVLKIRGWSTVWLPTELRRRPVDVFLGLSQYLPSSASYNIGFIYDLGFLHHPEAYPDSYRRLTKQTETLIRRANHIMAISHAVSDDIQKRYPVALDTITVSRPGIDQRLTPGGVKHNGPTPYFLSVGSLKRGKNIPTAIRAFAGFLRQIHKSYDYYLIGGDYWLDPQIIDVITECKLQERVKMLGVVADDVLASYYRGAVALVAPSLWEGFCLPAAEAMACGCPVIGSTAGALPEIVAESGILIDPLDVAGFAQAMRAIVSSPKMRIALKQKGLTRAKLFRWDAFARHVYQCIPVRSTCIASERKTS